MTTLFRVEHNAEGEWLQAVREDLYDGTNDDVLERPAEFLLRKSAEMFIDEIRGLMHCGGGDVEFRIVEVDAPAQDTDPLALPLEELTEWRRRTTEKS